MRITNVPSNKHLTAAERKAITAIIEAGLTKGRVGRKDYFITAEENGYSVKIQQNQSNDYGKMSVRTYTTTFNIKQ